MTKTACGRLQSLLATCGECFPLVWYSVVDRAECELIFLFYSCDESASFSVYSGEAVVVMLLQTATGMSCQART